MRKLLALTVAFALWLPAVHLFFHRDPETLVPALAQGQVQFWEAATADSLRTNNPEWDLMARTFAVLSFANLALKDETQRPQLTALIGRIVDDTERAERESGIHHFMLPYGQTASSSLFVDGEVALMEATRQLLAPGDRGPLEQRVRRIESTLRASPLLVGESYPDEGWVFCNTVALAALRVSDAALGTSHDALFREWVGIARAHWVAPRSGLLISSFHMNGAPRDGPEGSTLWLAAHMLQLVDAPFAREQYVLAREKLGHTALGFGWASEWPAEWPGHDDIDSGPTIPLVNANAGSSGLALVGARAFGDDAYLGALISSLGLAAFPTERDGTLKYAAGNTLADAVTLYSLTEGPLWACVKGEARCSAPQS